MNLRTFHLPRPPFLSEKRIALFVFVASEQLLVSIVPLFSKALASVEAGSLRVSMPMVAFVFAGLLGNSIGGRLIETQGLRAALIAGYLLALFGYVSCTVAPDVWALAGARAAAGVGYSIVTLGLQVRMISGEDARRALSAFTSIIMSALAFGSVAGGFLAAFLGFRAVFLLSALCIALVFAVEWFSAPRASDSLAKNRSGGGFAPLACKDFRDLLVNVAIPVKVVLSGFVFYFIPLYLQNENRSTAYIGCIIVLYSIFMVPSVYLGSLLLSKVRNAPVLIAAASIATGLLLLFAPMNIAFAVAGIGICHGVVSVPTLTAVMAISTRAGVSSTDFLAVVRSGERVGSVIGPALTALILTMAGFQGAPWILGALALALALRYALGLAGRAEAQA